LERCGDEASWLKNCFDILGKIHSLYLSKACCFHPLPKTRHHPRQAIKPLLNVHFFYELAGDPKLGIACFGGRDLLLDHIRG
jgi:hypothetical protein